MIVKKTLHIIIACDTLDNVSQFTHFRRGIGFVHYFKQGYGEKVSIDFGNGCLLLIGIRVQGVNVSQFRKVRKLFV